MTMEFITNQRFSTVCPLCERRVEFMVPPQFVSPDEEIKHWIKVADFYKQELHIAKELLGIRKVLEHPDYVSKQTHDLTNPRTS